ncbi:MAG: Unknown protein [uncultured Aureispira sp.]|uniref:DUF4136 domain-containing protein n=1 Tax=uncultured Aureispira sp. TaxID=1331704 RepID=A0A6S6RXJ2_9BACT|nr:MAG: Unknown protein [uncultured Aureispira sp.]
MTMNKIWLLYLLLFIQATSFAQTDVEAIRQTAEIYMEIVEQKKYQKTMDYLYPKLFDLVPRSLMEEALKAQEEQTDIELEIKDSKIEAVSKVLRVEAVKYALVNYSFLMIMTIPEEDKDGLEMMKGLFELNYGAKNVSLDVEKRAFSINVASAAYLINDPEYDGWKLLERKKELLPLLEKILPKKVLKKLK